MSSTASTSTAVDVKEITKATTRTSLRKCAKATNTAGRLELRTKSTLRKPKIGRLSQFMRMPMDILMEIFGHLYPLDLLHLARTTKAFRRLLMHRSSLFVWKSAISNVPGFPDCPPEMSEPQWANLAFGTHCNLCFRPNTRHVDWILRVRLCTPCAILYIADWFDTDYDPDVVLAVPYRLAKARPLFLKYEYEKVYAQYQAIENPDARQAFFVERHQLVKRIHEHATLCVAWANAQAVARSDELDRPRSSRHVHQTIVDKLVALGWGMRLRRFLKAML